MSSPIVPTSEPGQAIGLLGGSFDPPHTGHLEMALQARDRLGLLRVVLLPAPVPPHKNGLVARFEDRLEMARLLIRACRGLEVSDLEATLPAPHFTVQTLRHLSAAPMRGARLHLIMGADSLADLHLWREPEALFGLARVIVVSRPGFVPQNPRLSREWFDRIVLLDGVECDVSSTVLRRSLARGLRPPALVDSVWEYIVRRGLYIAS